MKMLFSLIILIAFTTFQSFALVCESTCAETSKENLESQTDSVPDCHRSEKHKSEEKKNPSCDSICQHDFLNSGYSTSLSIQVDEDKFSWASQFPCRLKVDLPLQDLLLSHSDPIQLKLKSSTIYILLQKFLI